MRPVGHWKWQGQETLSQQSPPLRATNYEVTRPVPVCLWASHAAHGSIRMEPVFLMLGQSAATAACLAIDTGLALQDLPYPALRKRLLADGLVLE